MEEKDNKILSENTENNKTPENKPSLSEMYYGSNLDTFSQNDNIDREYLKELYGEDMPFLNKDVRMTRSQYIAAYNRIQEKYKKELKGTVKSFLFLLVLLAFVILISTVFGLMAEDAPFASPFIILRKWTMIIGIPPFLFFIITLLKRLKDAQKSMDHALKTLEKSKNDCMAEGQYDAGS